MGISGIGGSADLTAVRQQMLDRVFKKMDSNGDGGVSKDELQAVTDQLKSEAPKGAQANAPSVDDIFKTTDSNGDGLISKGEFSAQAAKMAAGRPPPGGGPPGGGPPGGGPPGGGGGTSSLVGSASSKKLSVDPADTDGDGKVSAAERRAYDYKLMMEKLAEKSSSKDGESTTSSNTSSEARINVVA